MTISVIFASTSGHTEFVVERLRDLWQGEGHIVTMTKAEIATAKDFQKDDLLVLGSGTWNTGGIEGQLNPHMHELLFERIKEIDLKEKPVALVSLGDDRYYFTTRCTEHFMKWLKQANGKVLPPPLIIVNEPYDQKDRIEKWGRAIVPVSTPSHALS